jgi:hypothetical protein
MHRYSLPLVMCAGLFCLNHSTSAQIVNLETFTPSDSGALCSIARDPETGNIWVYPCFGSDVLAYSASGEAVGSVPRPGESANDVDLAFTPEEVVIADSTVPANTLFFVNGETGVAEIYALDKTTGVVVDTLVAGFGNSHTVGGAYHAERNTFFLVQDNVPAAALRNRIAEIDPITGDTLQTFSIEAEFNVSYGDLDISGVTGNLFVVSSIQTSIAEFTPDGEFVQRHDLPSGVGSLSGIALDCASQEAWVSRNSNTLYHLGAVPCGVPTAIESDYPAGYHLSSIYPNPFQEHATLILDLDRPQYARVTVYDLLGRMVEVVHEGYMQPGEQQFTLAGGLLPSGTYLIRIEGEDFLDTHRVVRIE